MPAGIRHHATLGVRLASNVSERAGEGRLLNSRGVEHAIRNVGDRRVDCGRVCGNAAVRPGPGHRRRRDHRLRRRQLQRRERHVPPGRPLAVTVPAATTASEPPRRPGEDLEACEHTNHRGRCQVFSNTESNLGQSGWNDRISSLRRARGGGGSGWGGGGNVPRDGVVLYDQRNFQGDRRVVMSAVANLGSMGFNDCADSLELGGSEWKLCRDINFRNCEIVRRSTSSLSKSWHVPPHLVAAASLRWRMGRKRRQLEHRRRRSSRALRQPQLRGQVLGFDFAVAKAGIHVGAGRESQAERPLGICDQPDFRGQCRVVTENVSDLNRIGWKDCIQSARPR